MPKVNKKSFKIDNMMCKDNIYCCIHQKCNGCNIKKCNGNTNLLNENPDTTLDSKYEILLYTLGLYSIYSTYNKTPFEKSTIRSILDKTNTHPTYNDKLHYYLYALKEHLSI